MFACACIRVSEFYEGKIHYESKIEVNLFLVKNIPKRSIYDVLQRYCKRIAVKSQPMFGRKVLNIMKLELKQLKQLFDKNDRVYEPSTLRLLNSFFLPSYLHKIITEYLMSNITRKLVISMRTKKRMISAKTKCYRLSKIFSDRRLILYD